VPTKSITCAQGLDFASIPKLYRTKHLRTESRAQFCPLCLAEAAYQRRAWQLKMVSACAQHQCLLVDLCPQCGRPITVADLITARCNTCQFSLADSPTVDLSCDKEGLQAQAILYYWAQAGPHVRISLPTQPARELFTLLHCLRQAVATVDEDLDGIHSFPEVGKPFNWKARVAKATAENYIATATALQAMRDWPQGFFAFLDRFGQRDKGAHSLTVGSWLGKLLDIDIRGHWQLSEYFFVRDALVEYVTRNWPAPLVNKHVFFKESAIPLQTFKWMLNSEAAVALNVTERTAKLLVLGGLIGVKEGIEAQRNKFLVRDDVMALKYRWGKAIPLTDAAAWLGVSQSIVIDMVALGLLVAVRRPGENGSSSWQISRETIEDLLAKLHSLSLSQNQNNARVDLAKAAQILAVHGYNAASIVQAVLNKSLRGYCSLSQPLGEMSLYKSSITKLVDKARDNRKWLSRQQVAGIMRVKPEVIDLWANSGLLDPVSRTKKGTFFRAQDVEIFKVDYVLTSEAMRLVGVGTLTIQKWTRAGRIKPVSGPGVDDRGVYLFRKRDLERLKQENRLSLPQLARHWDVSPEQLRVWIQNGQLKPFSGPGIDECGRYMFLRDELRLTSIPCADRVETSAGKVEE